MNLELIKKLSEKRDGGIKELAADVGMSEQNLHRCIRNNKIQASDLETIALHLNVSISYFFGGEAQKNDSLEIERLKKELEELRQSKSPDKLYELWTQFMENQAQYHRIIQEMASIYSNTQIKQL